MKLLKNKAISIVLTVSLLATMTAGCSKNTDSSSKDSGAGSSAAADAGANEKQAFKYWVPMKANTAKYYTDLNDNPAAARIKEDTGVDVDYVSPQVGNEKTEMNLLLAGGDKLPDAMRYDFNSNYAGGYDAAVEDGILLDATKLIEQYAPNFMKIINSDPELKRAAYNDSGKIAYFGSAIATEGMKGRSFNGPMINENLLKKAGLDVPKTIADWETMLAKFKDMGVKSVFCFDSNNKLAGLQNAFSGAYGVTSDTDNNFINVNGTIKYSPMESGYKEFLELFNKWYKNGWLDADFLSKKNKDNLVLFEQGDMGASVRHVVSIKNAPLASVQKEREKLTVVAAPYPVLNEGEKVHLKQNVPTFNKSPVFISAKAESPITIVKWIDYLYSEKGMEELDWGTKGDSRYADTYVEDADGKRHLAEMFTTGEADTAKYMMKDLESVWDWDYQKEQYTPYGAKEPYPQACWDIWEACGDTSYELPQTMTMTAKEREEFDKIMGDIKTLVQEKSVKYIMGKETFDTYDNFLKTIENMNIKKAIELQQAALDRYLAR